MKSLTELQDRRDAAARRARDAVRAFQTVSSTDRDGAARFYAERDAALAEHAAACQAINDLIREGCTWAPQ